MSRRPTRTERRHGLGRPRQITIKDATTALTAGAKCTQVDANTVNCPDDGVTQLDFNLGALNDTFNNRRAVNANVTGGSGTDIVINSGNGNDFLSLKGYECDQVNSCGAGDNDKADLDHRDVLQTNSGCETVFVDDVQILPVPVTPPPAGGGPATPPPLRRRRRAAAPAGQPGPDPAGACRDRRRVRPLARRHADEEGRRVRRQVHRHRRPRTASTAPTTVTSSTARPATTTCAARPATTACTAWTATTP